MYPYSSTGKFDNFQISFNGPGKMDLFGKMRITDIPDGLSSDKIVTADAAGNIREIYVNKSYVQTFKTTKSFGTANAALLNLFPEVTIQPGKKVKLDIYVPTRSNTNS